MFRKLWTSQPLLLQFLQRHRTLDFACRCNSTRCVPRDERFGHLKMSDFLVQSLKAIVQFLVPELKSLFDSTMNEFNSFKDIKKLFSDGKKFPNNSILEAAKNFIPFELVKEFLTIDGEKLFRYPLPQVIAREYFSCKHVHASFYSVLDFYEILNNWTYWKWD